MVKINEENKTITVETKYSISDIYDIEESLGTETKYSIADIYDIEESLGTETNLTDDMRWKILKKALEDADCLEPEDITYKLISAITAANRD